MKRTEVRIVRLPLLLTDDSLAYATITNLADATSAKSDELNARAYEYGRRTAIPTLDDCVISSFSDAVKSGVLEEAKNVVGVDDDGILKMVYKKEIPIGGYKLIVSVNPTSPVLNERVYTRLRYFLEQVAADNAAGKSREGVRKVNDVPYIFLEYLMSEIARLRQEHTSRSIRQDLSVVNLKDNAPVPLDEAIEKMEVYLDQRRYSKLNEMSVRDFLSAKSLNARIQGFLGSFEKKVRSDYGVREENLTERVDYNYEFDDNSAVRYLFFPRPLIKYSEILAGLEGQETKSITASTGDLNILFQLAFQDDYTYRRGGSSLAVSTETKDSPPNQGMVKIIRTKDGSQETMEYGVFRTDGRIYADVGSITQALDLLLAKHSSTPTQLKIDFFPAPPEYLGR